MYPTTMEAQDSATLLWGLMAKKVETADRTSHCPETVTALKSPHESTPSKCIHWAPALPVGAAPEVPPPHGNTLQCHPLPMGAPRQCPTLPVGVCPNIPAPLPADSSPGVLHPLCPHSAPLQPHTGPHAPSTPAILPPERPTCLPMTFSLSVSPYALG